MASDFCLLELALMLTLAVYSLRANSKFSLKIRLSKDADDLFNKAIYNG